MDVEYTLQDGTDRPSSAIDAHLVSIDIDAFAKALGPAGQNDDNVEFIKALNDWRPVHEYVQRKKRKRKVIVGADEKGSSATYFLLRWPLLVFVVSWITFLGAIYLLVRLYVSIYENLVTWRGARQRLRKKLRNVTDYREWKEAAVELDTYLHHDEWREESRFDYYDHLLLRKFARKLRLFREKNDIPSMRMIVESCTRSNFGGVESPRLYSATYYGTKTLVDVYLAEVEKCLRILLETPTIPRSEKAIFFKNMSKNYGRTALCLSGGASFAYYHFGVVRALLDASLLPNVITGTSGGGIVAALACCYNETELQELLVPELATKISACHEDLWTCMVRWSKTGAQFDAVDWARRSTFFTRGSMTFKEAYERYVAFLVGIAH